MPSLELPRTHVAALHELGIRALGHRKSGSPFEPLARELLAGFYDVCMRHGLDGLLVQLGEVYPPLDLDDRSALAEQPAVFEALVTRLAALGLDGGGPRNARPGQLADALLGALGVTLVDEPDRSITLDDSVRTAVVAAVAGIVDPELAVPRIRENIVAAARERCEERHHAAFDKIAPQLDDRGLQIVRLPKVPLDSLHAVQRALVEGRNAVIDRVGRMAIDRAKDVLERANPEAAARIDQPVTLRSTPRDIAILRACEARVPKVPAQVVASLIESLTELARLQWVAPERVARPYAASQTFAVGDLIDHPKFGRGEVVACKAARIEVEFADGKRQLVHVAAAT